MEKEFNIKLQVVTKDDYDTFAEKLRLFLNKETFAFAFSCEEEQRLIWRSKK